MLRRALALAPADRFESASAFVRALGAALTGPEPAATTALRIRPPGGRGLAVGAAAVLGLALAGVLLRVPAPRDPAANDARLVDVFPFTIRA